MSHLLHNPPRVPMIFPSILGADFTRMGQDCSEVLALGAEGLHVDVMDGHFVPNLTMGPDMVRAIRRLLPNAYLDVHLMVTEPAAFVQSFADAGANCLTFHIETTIGRKSNHEHDLISAIQRVGCQVGVALNPSTPAAAVMHLLDKVDMTLVMSVHPGFSGQMFMTDVLSKTRAIRDAAPKSMRVEMDGGINTQTSALCRAAGCDVIVAASALFGAADRKLAMQSLRGA